MPLPWGVYDFNGNISVPHLHNSFLTVVLKFGLVGLVIISAYLGYLAVKGLRLRATTLGPYAMAGFWIVAFVAGKGVTLQGLTEWSHVLFLGMGATLVHAPRYLRSDNAGFRSVGHHSRRSIAA
jgi:O-antigen ligase